MTASVRVIMRHDTGGEWILADELSPRGNGGAWSEPARENWTILSESPVELSYKAALSATPLTTAPCSPDIDVMTSMGGLSSMSSKKGKKSSSTVASVPPQRLPSDSDDGGCDMYQMRKGRVAGGSVGKSRNNRRK
jgi:hypothetical protein